MIAKTPPTPERKIIAGIDFGATYSGLAWADTEQPERRETVTAWPGRHGVSSDKVPTRLRYAGDDVQWGFGIPSDSPREEAIEWFKLDLDPSLRSMKQAISNGATHRNVDTLMTDYISALVKHLTKTLTQELGREALSTPIELFATVPALWTETAKHKTRRACEAASRKINVHIVSEPEAAATYAIHSLNSRGLGAGDTIMVLDAGGGTVDLASHTIKSLDPELKLTEAAPGTGALCGSAFLDLRFGMYLRAKLGGVDGFGKRVLASAVDHFEKKTKREFTLGAGPDESFLIPVPGLADNRALGVTAGYFAAPASDLHTIFEPVILEITKLVSEQVSSMANPPNTLLLVGGFGASDYLKESLKMALGKGVEIMRPRGAWRAVAQGAVIKGLEMAGVRTEERSEVKRYYGTEWVSKYDEKLHASIRGKRYWCGLDGCYKVSAMQWFTEKDNSSEDPALETPFNWTAPVAKGRIRTVKLDIYACDTDGSPPLSRDASVKLLRRVEADLSSIPVTELKRRKGLDGRMWYDLRCRIEAARGRGDAVYTLVYNGTRRYEFPWKPRS